MSEAAAPLRFTPDLSRRLMALTLAIATVGLQALMVAPLLTDMARDLGVGPAVIGRANGLYGVGVAVAALLAAPRLDGWPRRRVLALALAALGLALAGCALAADAVMLSVAMAACGLAAGVVLPTTYALAGDLAPQELRSRAVGRVIVGWSVAMVLGVPAAALLAEQFGWRGAYAVIAAVAGVAALAVLGLPAGVRHQGAQLVPYRVALAQPGVLRLLAMTLAYMAAFYGCYTFLTDHLRAADDLGPSLGGWISLSYGLGFGIAVVGDGLIDRLGPWRVAAPAFVLLAGIMLLLPLAASQSPWAVVALALPWGVANHFGLNVLVSLLSSGVASVRGAVLGLYSAVTYFAHFLAGAGLGLVYAGAGFTMVAVVAAVGLVLAAGMALSPALRRRA
jgi:MFS transporter, DHA1 family, inner membrane transport protein